MADPADARERLLQMRREYQRTGLDEADLAAAWPAQFARWLADAVRADVPEPNAMVLATAGGDGRPSARTVLLKEVDERGFAFYTNLRSRKGADLADNPYASLVFGWRELARQVVVVGAVEPVDPAEADAYFAARPRGAQLGALASPQSAPIAGRDVLELAWADLGARFPVPAPVPRPAHWSGVRVVPGSVEFWQGRPDRLHDRLRYRREGDEPRGRWRIERLAP